MQEREKGLREGKKRALKEDSWTLRKGKRGITKGHGDIEG